MFTYSKGRVQAIYESSLKMEPRKPPQQAVQGELGERQTSFKLIGCGVRGGSLDLRPSEEFREFAQTCRSRLPLAPDTSEKPRERHPGQLPGDRLYLPCDQSQMSRLSLGLCAPMELSHLK